MVPRTYWVETLGCPKNAVDSDKITGRLLADGCVPARTADSADLVVVNTCAFVEEARQESIDTILGLSDTRLDGAKLVVTGCLAERYGAELAESLPEVDRVVGFGGPLVPPAVTPVVNPAVTSAGGPDTNRWIPVTIGAGRGSEQAVPAFDLLNMPRPAPTAPWAYLKVAEGGVREIVLVAQDLASYGRDQGVGTKQIVPLVDDVAAIVDRVRLLYLYPSELTDGLVDAICRTGVPYFDLSLQHVSRPLVRRMRRWGDGRRYLERIRAIRAREPDAVFRSNFIVGYPGETEADHDELLGFVEEAQLDWCGFFSYSEEDGTHAAGLDGHVHDTLVHERLIELRGMQDDITAQRRDALVGRTVSVLVDEVGAGRSHREAPEIDGVVHLPDVYDVGSIVDVEVVAAEGPDVRAVDPAVDPPVDRAVEPAGAPTRHLRLVR